MQYKVNRKFENIYIRYMGAKGIIIRFYPFLAQERVVKGPRATSKV